MKLKLLLPINRSAFFLKFIMHDFIFEIMEHINKPFLFIQLKYFTRNLFNKISTMP